MTRPLLVLPNSHSNSAGQSPSWEGQCPSGYVGYFMNQYGEQLVFSYDYTTHQGWLWHGDATWQERFPVVRGKAQIVSLNNLEEMWLMTCWLVATAALPEEYR